MALGALLLLALVRVLYGGEPSGVLACNGGDSPTAVAIKEGE